MDLDTHCNHVEEVPASPPAVPPQEHVACSVEKIYVLVQCKDLEEWREREPGGEIHTSWPKMKKEHCEEVTQRG